MKLVTSLGQYKQRTYMLFEWLIRVLHDMSKYIRLSFWINAIKWEM